MAGSPLLARMRETGSQFIEMSQKNAEKIVADFVKAGTVRREDAEQIVQQLVDRGRSATEYFVGMIQAEVAKQFAWFAQRLEDIEVRVEDVAGSLRGTSKSPAEGVATSMASEASQAADGVSSVAARPVTVENTAVRKASGKAASAARSVAKKAPGKAASAAKTAAKKGASAAKKASATSSPAKKTASKRAPAKR